MQLVEVEGTLQMKPGRENNVIITSMPIHHSACWVAPKTNQVPFK